MNLNEDLDNPESEVELDSLGSFFIHLIDNDHYQDDAEASRANDVELIILSSGSDPQPTQKSLQANRKVKFSHPLAYLDPNFLLKKQQYEARRTTRHSGQVVTSFGLPNTPIRKRRLEVSSIPDTSYPKAGYFRQPLIHLTQTTRELPIHPLANQQGHNFHLLRLFLGKHTTLNSLSLAPV